MTEIAEHYRRTIALERIEAERNALERAATFLENYATNDLYHKALVMGAKLIRKLKDATPV